MTPVKLPALLAMVLILLLAVALLYIHPARASGDEPPEPEPTPLISPRQEKPVIPENPLLADKGSITYWAVCMACHGDAGQGLTDEWRQVAFGEDMDCWQSRCHAANHPPQGFDLPRTIPPVVGPNTLRRFVTADELHPYLLESMPWWNPASLSETESWELTAFLLRKRGALPEKMEFIPHEAHLAPVHLPIRSLQPEFSGQMVFMASLALLAALYLAGSALRFPTETGAKASNGLRPNFFLHLHPPTIPLLQARFRYTLGAGGLAVFLSLILGLTGILEMYFYIPTPEQAGPSIQTITFLVPFGRLVRGLHFWAAQALLVVATVHLIRVVFTGAYTPPRRFNYLLGLALFVLILFLDFTGYVLRWDEGIRWALVVGTNLLRTFPLVGERIYGFIIGGDQPGLAALTRFYAWHIFGLTAAFIGLIVWHIFRVRRDGGISAPAPEARPDLRRISRFELFSREALVALLAGIALILIASLIPAPLAVPISDSSAALQGDIKAPWFFMWVQQLLRYGDAFWLGVALPLGFLALLAALPYLFKKLPEDQKGRWFPPAGRAAQLLLALLVLAWVILTFLELKL